MRVAFAGSPEAAATALRFLVASRHEVALVITQPDRRRGRSRRPQPTPVGLAAADLGLTLRQPASINDDEVLGELRSTGARALVVVAFGQILREPLLSEWPCINVHFSLLPAYRGAAPVERALMDGVAETGVTIMQMDAGLDTGPTISEARVAVGAEVTGGELTALLAEEAGGPLVAALDALERGELVTTPQPEAGVSLAPRIVAEDRPLDPARTAAELANHVRALAPHIGATLALGGEPHKVWSATAEPGRALDAPIQDIDGRLYLRSADGAIEIRELQPPGKARMPADAFLRGHRGDLSVDA